MLNAEKYKEQIENEGNPRPNCYIAQKIMKNACSGQVCSECNKKIVGWLLEEYEEPILSQEGKDCLKQMIAPFKPNQVTSVIKGDRNFYIYFGSNCTVYDNETLDEKMELFKKMNDCKEYKLEELGL